MTPRIFLPLALLALAAPAFGQAVQQGKAVPKATAVNPPTAPAVPAPAAPAAAPSAPGGDKPLTEADLLKRLDDLKVGDPIKAAPASASPMLRGPGQPGAPGTPGAPGSKEQDQTEITAKEATFESKTHQAVFLKDVVVVNPQFTVTCDKLTAFMKHSDDAAAPGAAPAGGAAPAAGATPPADAKAGGPAAGKKAGKKGAAAATPDVDASGKSSGGLERAIAEGNVVITQDKMDDNGVVTHSIGHGRKAVYEAATGDITLTGHPDTAQGMNTLEATEDSTIIILNREGRMKAIGPHKTIIRDSSDADPNNPLSGGAGKTKTSSATPATTTNAR